MDAGVIFTFTGFGFVLGAAAAALIIGQRSSKDYNNGFEDGRNFERFAARKFWE